MAASKGNCYICGAELGKTAMKNHILKDHNGPSNGQECCLLKIEGAYEKGYWLYVDIPIDRSLSVLDTFLRKIWLECCGHMSGFRGAGKSTKLSSLEPGYQFIHEYDYGDTTETLITVIGRIKRPAQKGIVRLLARNIPPVFQCAECGATAEFICTECQYDSDNPFFCAKCVGEHEHEDLLLPVVNSPRMGVCGYCGELDTFGYVTPEDLTHKKGKSKTPSAKAADAPKGKPEANAGPLYPDELYELAFKLKKTKLWEKLFEDEIFAISLPGGETGYCVVMGMMGEHYALALYTGQRGLDSFRNIQQYAGLMDSGVSPLKAQEFMLSQRCVQCSFENKDELSAPELASVRAYAARHDIKFRGACAFPQFVKFLPASFPRNIAAEDVKPLAFALRAALAVNERLMEGGWSDAKKEALGFSTGLAYDRPYPLMTPDGDGFTWSKKQLPSQTMPEYPRPSLRDDLLTERLKRAKKQNTSWVCDLIMLPTPLMDEGDETPYFAYMLMIADKRTETVIPSAIVRDYEEYADELLHGLGEKMLENGVPRQLIVTDDRTYSFLENFADSTKIRLVQNQKDELLEDIEEDFARSMDDDFSDYPEGEPIEMVAALFRDASEDDLLSIPDPIWNSLRMAVEDADVPEEFLRRFNELDKKRK